MLTGQLNVAWCEVDSGDCCSGERVLAQVDALATADIKDVQAGGALVVEGVGHPGCVGSASGEEVAGVFCGRAARIGRPLLDRTRLRVSHGVGVNGAAIEAGLTLPEEPRCFSCGRCRDGIGVQRLSRPTALRQGRRCARPNLIFSATSTLKGGTISGCAPRVTARRASTRPSAGSIHVAEPGLPA